MKKISFFAIIIVFLLLLGGVLALINSMDSNKELGSVSTSSDTPNSSNPLTPSESETNEETVQRDGDVVLQLGDENLYMSYVVKDSLAQVGFVANGLKPNTEYRIDWNINDRVFIETPSRLNTEIIDGEVKNCIYLNTSYEPDEGLGDILTSYEPSYLLNGGDGEGWTFVTEGEGSAVVIFFFKVDYVSAEQMNTLCDSLENYVTELTFTELK